MTLIVVHLLVAPLLAALGLWTVPGPAPDVALEMAPDAAVWPLDPRPQVVRGFDPPADAWAAGHRGVDLLGSPGQAVRAARGGVVTFAGKLAGRGVIVVDHGSTRTTYEPVSASRAVGERVHTGNVIGHLQRFGSHCFPRTCLHWGLIEGADHYLDPLSLVGGGPVRLLPLDGDPPGAQQWSGMLPPPGVPPPAAPRVAIPRQPGSPTATRVTGRFDWRASEPAVSSSGS